MGLELGFLGLLILAVDIWAILKTAESAASTGAKAIWIVVILAMPVLGLLIWFIFGPKGNA